MILVAVVLLMCFLLVFAWFVRKDITGQQKQAEELGERLRIEHERFMAELRLQRMTHSALQQLLDDGRQRSAEPS